MIHSTLVTLLLLVFLHSASGKLTLNDVDRIVGQYSNLRGDKLTVNILSDEDNYQPDLFDPKEIRLEILFIPNQKLPDGRDLFALTESNFSSFKDGIFTFELRYDDCDNPGCSNYYLSLAIKPKKNNDFWIEVTLDVETEVNQYIEEETDFLNFSDPNEEEMQQICQDYTGNPDAHGDNNGWAYCYYSYKIFMTKK